MFCSPTWLHVWVSRCAFCFSEVPEKHFESHTALLSDPHCQCSTTSKMSTWQGAACDNDKCSWGQSRHLPLRFSEGVCEFGRFHFITASDSYLDPTNETVPCGWRCCCCCRVAFVAALLAVLHLLLVLVAFGLLQLLLFLLSPWLSLFLGVGFYRPKVLLWSADLPQTCSHDSMLESLRSRIYIIIYIYVLHIHCRYLHIIQIGK